MSSSTPVDDSAEILASLLNSLRLPSDLRYAPGEEGHRPTEVSRSASAAIPDSTILILDESAVDDILHPLLLIFAQIMASPRYEAQRRWVEDHFKTMTSSAGPYAYSNLSGETGLRNMLSAHLIEPLNFLIGQSYISERYDGPSFAEGRRIVRVFWRSVGGGASPKPDFELVIHFADGSERIIAPFELETIVSMSHTTVMGLFSKLHHGIHFPIDPANNPGRGRLRYDDSNEKRIVTQVSSQYFANHRSIQTAAILSNHECLCVFAQRDDGCIAVSERLHPSGTSTPWRLHGSQLGAILAGTLLALDKAGYGAMFRPFASPSGLALEDQEHRMSSSDTVRPGHLSALASLPLGLGSALPHSSHHVDQRGVDRDGTRHELSPGSASSDGPDVISPTSPELSALEPKRDTPPSPPAQIAVSKLRRDSPYPSTIPSRTEPTKRVMTETSSFVVRAAGKIEHGTRIHLIGSLFSKYDVPIVQFRVLPDTAIIDKMTDASQLENTDETSSESTQLVLVEALYYGHVFMPFRARSQDSQVIVKICHLGERYEVQRSESEATITEATTEISMERNVLSQVLRSKQGGIVPHFYGLGVAVINDERVYACITEDAGAPIHPGVRVLSRVRDRIRDIYDELHDAGVLHGDVEWRHVLSRERSQTNLCLIDFGRAKLRSDMSDQEWQISMKREQLSVESMLSTREDVVHY